MHFYRVLQKRINDGKYNLHENERCFPITLINTAAFRVTFVNAAIVFCLLFVTCKEYGEVGSLSCLHHFRAPSIKTCKLKKNKHNFIIFLLYQKRKLRNSLEELLKMIEKSFVFVILGYVPTSNLPTGGV